MILYDQNIWGNFNETQTIGNRCELVYDLISEIRPDICCFQECNPMTARAGERGIEHLMANDFVEISGEHSGVNFTPVFVRRGAFEIVKEGWHCFCGLNDIQSKSATYAVLEHRQSGKRLVVVSTHFWWQHGEESDRQRVENARELNALLEGLCCGENLPVIVAGDLNSEDRPQENGQAGCDEMLRLGFESTRYLSRTTVETATCRRDYPIRGENDVYYGGTMPEYTIDHILVRGGVRCEDFDVLTCQTALDSSDHCPLVLRFELE